MELDNDNTPSLGEIEENNGNSNKDKVQFQSSSDFFYNKQLWIELFSIQTLGKDSNKTKTWGGKIFFHNKGQKIFTKASE